MMTTGIEHGHPGPHEAVMQQLSHQVTQGLPEKLQALSHYSGWVAAAVILSAFVVGINRYLDDRREYARLQEEEAEQKTRRTTPEP